MTLTFTDGERFAVDPLAERFYFGPTADAPA